MGALDYLKILKEHLIRTGFQDKYNELLDLVIYDVQNDGNGNLVFYTNIDTITIPFSTTLNQLTDVDLSAATSGDVLTFDGTNWIAAPFGSSFSSSTPSTRFTDIQGVSSVEDALLQILYPYQSPTFASFSINSQVTTLELGQEVSSSGTNKTFAWSLTNLANISTIDGFNIVDTTASQTLASVILPNSTTSRTITIPYQIVRTTNGATYTFTISSKDTRNNTFSRQYSITWRPRIFYGVSALTSLTSNAQVEALAVSPTGGSRLVSSIVQSFTVSGNSLYIYIVMPVSFGKAINEDGGSSRFVVGGLSNSAWSITPFTYTNSYGHAENYYVYRSSTIQAGTNIQINIV